MAAVNARTTMRLKPLGPKGGGGFKRRTCQRAGGTSNSADCSFGKGHVSRRCKERTFHVLGNSQHDNSVDNNLAHWHFRCDTHCTPGKLCTQHVFRLVEVEVALDLHLSFGALNFQYCTRSALHNLAAEDGKRRVPGVAVAKLHVRQTVCGCQMVPVKYATRTKAMFGTCCRHMDTNVSTRASASSASEKPLKEMLV